MASMLGKLADTKGYQATHMLFSWQKLELAISRESVGDGSVYTSKPSRREMASLFRLGHWKGARPEEWDVQGEGPKERREKAEVAESSLDARP